MRAREVEHRRPCRAARANSRQPQKLLPHEEIGGQPVGSRRPALREAPVGGERVRTARERDEVRRAGEHTVAKGPQGEIEGPAQQLAVGGEVHCHGACEISFGEQSAHRLNVLGKPEVVVAQVANDLAARALEHRVAIRLAVSRALGMVDEPHALVPALDVVHDLARDVRNAVADHDHLDIPDRLLERALESNA